MQAPTTLLVYKGIKHKISLFSFYKLRPLRMRSRNNFYIHSLQVAKGLKDVATPPIMDSNITIPCN